MAISSIQNDTARAQAATSTAQTATQQPEIGRDAFMKMLVAQLRNQDPLDPLDSREFVTQLSQLTSVEELVTIRNRMEALEVGIAGMANTQVAGIVGRTVTADASALRLDEQGSASTAFNLEGRATDVTVTIRDESGQVVRTMELGETFPGSHRLEWDGRTDSGERAAAGRYTIEIDAKDADGHPVTASTRITGVVSSISYEHGYPELLVGEAHVLLGDVISISQ